MLGQEAFCDIIMCMSPEVTGYKILAFRNKEKTFGGTQVFIGTLTQIAKLTQTMLDSWTGMGTEGLEIIYEGSDISDLPEAKKMIRESGLPSIDPEEVSIPGGE